MVARGEIWWYEHPSVKRRPYLVMTRDEAVGVVKDLAAIPATRRRRGVPWEVELDQADGMPHECVLRADQITSVQASLLTERITRLGADRMQEVCVALRDAVRC